MGRLIGRARRALPQLACVALLLSATTAAARTANGGDAVQPQTEDGAVWELQGPRGTLHIVGSVHLLDAGQSPLPATVTAAYDAAQRIVMEIDLDDIDEGAAARFTARNGTIASDAPDLPAQLGPRDWQRLLKACSQVSVPCESLNRLEPWALALLLSVSALTQQGLDPQLGVEEQIKSRAQRDGKGITGLETLEFQLGLFDSLTPRDQRLLLQQAVADINSGELEFDPLTRAWRRGDLRILERLLLREYRRFPGLYDALVYRRNLSWVPQVRALLDAEGDTLLLVGTLHLVGPRGLIALLQAEGLVVKRVRNLASLPAGQRPDGDARQGG